MPPTHLISVRRHGHRKANRAGKPSLGLLRRIYARHVGSVALAIFAPLGATGCGPHARVPATPVPVPAALTASDSQVRTARNLAPTLYLQRDERFRLLRVVAVVHPTRPVVAYHLLWRDDVHGAWIPFTVPTDQEVVWVGHDGRGHPTEVWTYWHGKVLHATIGDSGRVHAEPLAKVMAAAGRQLAARDDGLARLTSGPAQREPTSAVDGLGLDTPAADTASAASALDVMAPTHVPINVQWGKHGSIPRGTRETDYPAFRGLPTFYMLAWAGLPDIWLSNTMRKGPWCFCHGYRRYKDFSRPVPLADRLDVIVAGEKPGPALKGTFGEKYSGKKFWPWSHK